ncbi:MAG: peptide-methionine (R)-S-oxide reductase MsrB [Pseudomonadota bacterium]
MATKPMQTASPISNTKSDMEWREQLTSEQFRILRKHGTERPFTSPLLNEGRSGTFTCAGCGNPLYRSEAKYDSGTGWPSFFQSMAPDAVTEHADRSLFMRRTEIRCSRCDGHLGHVFPDGPAPTGLRYCMNGVALDFSPDANGEV